KDSAAKSKARPGAKARNEKPSASARPAKPSGVSEEPASQGAASGYGVDPQATITEHINRKGQTVYSITASHFDVSQPLRDMAGGAEAQAAVEGEAPENPLLPAWRFPRSNVPDPVVQPAIQASGPLSPSGFAIEAPSTGFSFAGLANAGARPSDSNGSVGNNQFVETVNARYQVWSLNRLTSTATSVMGPTNINALWSGFGGACQAQNARDPIVLFDKLANRWLISQFTSASPFFQCVALSTGADATGTYARWAFAVPNSRLGDYPKLAVWTNAYYMSAHAFSPSTGAYVGAL